MIKAKRGEEKRLFERKRLRSRVVFEDESGEGFIYFYSTDVSSGGIFFESDVPLKIGTKVFLSFNLPPENKIVRATGTVVRVEREKGGATVLGMGIQFVDITDQAQQQLDQYIKGTV